MSLKKPRLFYFDEGIGSYIPAPDKVEQIIDLDAFSGNKEKITITFIRFDMTDEEMKNLPEI